MDAAKLQARSIDSSVAKLSNESFIGLVLALSSSAFIGSSFIIKKKGLRKAAAAGVRAGAGGYGYLAQPLWWAGFLTMALGEAANFAAYAFAPAILVTPLGALSVIFSAVLAHYMLNERLNTFGVVGCLLCIVGSTTIVLHAPPEQDFQSVSEVFTLASQPAFSLYTIVALTLIVYLVFTVAPRSGTSNIFVYLAICSLVGSFTVISCKALGVAIKLTLSGNNQLAYPETYAFLVLMVSCITTQMNYLNKSLDLFNTAVVSPIYYVLFTTSTIVASMFMFKFEQSIADVVSEACGFLTIVGGTFILHVTKDLDAATLGAMLSNLTRPSARDDPSDLLLPTAQPHMGTEAPLKEVEITLVDGTTSSPAKGVGGSGIVSLDTLPRASNNNGVLTSSSSLAANAPSISMTQPSQRSTKKVVDEEGGGAGSPARGGASWLGRLSAGAASVSGSNGASAHAQAQRRGIFW